LQETYAGTDQVRFEYKHFAFLGNESTRAAEASECANEQGQFWPYHDTLFLNQRGENLGAFSDQNLKAFAVAIGLDEQAFNDCLDTDRFREVVDAEVSESEERAVRSTPTLFINGEKMEGVVPFERLQSIIEAELNSNG
jgi:protein-disulfide isomerase